MGLWRALSASRSITAIAAPLILAGCFSESSTSATAVSASSVNTSHQSAVTISGSPAGTIVAGQTYRFVPSTADPSGGRLIFSIRNEPAWAQFDPSSGRLSGSPSAAQAGTYSNISISVSSGDSTASLPPFVIHVQAPTLTIYGTPNTSVVVGAVYSFQPIATYTGGGNLTFSIQNMPTWARFSATTGLLSGTPRAPDVKLDSDIVISVGNGNAAAALPGFSIDVLPSAAFINGACGSTNGIAVSAAPTTNLCSAGTASSVSGTGPWSWTCSGSNGGSMAQCAAPKIKSANTVTLHYAPNGNFDSNGNYVPAADGFNLADVSDAGTLNSLPSGVAGLVWIGQCNGADANFTAAIQPFIGNKKVFAYYLMDEPDPTGQYAPLCSAANLMAESDWIHANSPGAKTFIVMMNLGTPTSPSYLNTYNSANTHIDLFGLDPYPVRPQFSGGVDYGVITAGISAAEAEGISVGSIVPVFQAFGGGGYTTYTLPTAAQEQQILATWGAAVPTPAFDYAYSWGSQDGDRSLSSTPDLQSIFLQHNSATH